MSYNYTEVVALFAQARQKRYMVQSQINGTDAKDDSSNVSDCDDQQQQQAAVEALSTLSIQCPLTPLLWIQYAAAVADLYSGTMRLHPEQHQIATTTSTAAAAAAAATSLELETLQLGLTEFPGSALLQARAIVVQVQAWLSILQSEDSDIINNNATDFHSTHNPHLLESIQSAIKDVGQGSHRNEDFLVVILYRLWSTVLAVSSLHWRTMTATHKQQQLINSTDCTAPDEDLETHCHEPPQELRKWLPRIEESWVARSQTPMRNANETLEMERDLFLQPFNTIDGDDENDKNNNNSNGDQTDENHPTVTNDDESDVQHQKEWIQNLQVAMDQGRRWEAQQCSWRVPYEDAIDQSLRQSDGVWLARTQPEFQRKHTDPHSTTGIAPSATSGSECVGENLSSHGQIQSNDPDYAIPTMIARCWDHVDWDTIICRRSVNESGCYGMGLGGIETAQAFVRYARAANLRDPSSSRSSTRKNTDFLGPAPDGREQYGGVTLALAIYERAVAECPCVEFLWSCYLRDLQQWSTPSHTQREIGEKFQNWGHEQRECARLLPFVAARAVRNCPYSAPLLKQQLTIVLFLASLTMTVSTTNGNNCKYAAIVDPDHLLDMVQKGIDLQFLPKDPMVTLDAYMTAIGVVKRRILGLLANQRHVTSKQENPSANVVYYDDGEPLLPLTGSQPSKKQKRKEEQATHDKVVVADENDEEEALQEAQDLLDDLADMYDEAIVRIRKAWPSWTEGLALFWRERAQTESLFLKPLRDAWSTDIDCDADADIKDTSLFLLDSEVLPLLKSFEKAVRAHNPPHPDTYALYIRQYMLAVATVPATKSAVLVMIRLRRVRGLYEKAMISVGNSDKSNIQEPQVETKTSNPPIPRRDYDSALASLCNEWIEFEKTFGSERSVGKASKAIEKKLMKSFRQTTGSGPWRNRQSKQQSATGLETPIVSSMLSVEPSIKRPLESDADDERISKRTKMVDDATSTINQNLTTEADHVVPSTNISGAKTQKPTIARVHVGNLDYPAHEFTVRVSNLSMDTEDMDLVDTFRPKCGTIVQAKIIRDKHHQGGKGESKGWGLIQFEERSSVDKALALNDTLGINEKLVKVERSHMPAVSVVPAGLHRVRPKGEGKASKQNQKKRESTYSDQSHAASVAEKAVPSQPRVIPSTFGIPFRPRSVARGNHQKPRLNIVSGSQASNKDQNNA